MKRIQINVVLVEAWNLIEGLLGRVRAGDAHPVRIMGVINLSQESFYKGSIAAPKQVLNMARGFADQGADLIDLGAVSTAPGSPIISEVQEKERLFPALKSILHNVDTPLSVDTQRAKIAEEALSMGASCINDVSGFKDLGMAKAVAEHGSSAILMASQNVPGDVLALSQILRILGDRVSLAVEMGVEIEKIAVDPGVGRWVPEKSPKHDLAILDGFKRLRVLGRPIIAAVSRKSFIGAFLNQPDPSQRLLGSLAATAIAVYSGAHVVRTHDVALSMETIRMAQAIRGKPPRVEEDNIAVEVQASLSGECDWEEMLKQIGVDQRGFLALSRKAAFRVIRVSALSSIEAVIVKQEMLARGGDAAIPKLALRCDPNPQDILIFGTHSQISALARRLKDQPFRLPSLGRSLESSLKKIDDIERYG